jgi:hypothetical protein
MPRRLPFEYMDKVCLAATFAPWSSFAPTWRLGVRGAVPEAALATAVRWLAGRYPVLASTVVGLDAPMPRARRLAWQLDEAPDVGRLWSTLDLRSATPAARAQAEQALADRFLDLEHDYPFHLTWVRRGDDDGALFLQQHHALADGRAFLGLCAELVRFLDAAVKGQAEAAAAAAPFARLPELSVVPEQGLRRASAFLQGLGHSLWRGALDALFPLAPLRCNQGSDFSGHNQTEHLVVPVARLEAWRPKRKPLGLSENALLSAALALALGRWSARHGTNPGRTRLLLPMDTRPRERPFESFANHLSSVLLSCDLRRPPAVLELAASFGRQAATQTSRRTPLKKLLFEAAVAGRVSVDAMRRLVFEKRALIASLSFSNLAALEAPGAGEGGLWRGAGFTVESLRVTTPCLPPQGANTTAVRYGGLLCFNFNYKDSLLDRALVSDLVASFDEALAETDAALK